MRKWRSWLLPRRTRPLQRRPRQMACNIDANFFENPKKCATIHSIAANVVQCEASVKCGNSSVGRAQPCQGLGREFETLFPLQFPQKGKQMLPFFVREM